MIFSSLPTSACSQPSLRRRSEPTQRGQFLPVQGEIGGTNPKGWFRTCWVGSPQKGERGHAKSAKKKTEREKRLTSGSRGGSSGLEEDLDLVVACDPAKDSNWVVAIPRGVTHACMTCKGHLTARFKKRKGPTLEPKWQQGADPIPYRTPATTLTNYGPHLLDHH